MNGFPDALSLSAADWPPECRDARPGDLRAFVPQGFGLGAPAVIMPYGGPPSGGYYGFQPVRGDPLRDAPLTDPGGGTLYFDDAVAPEELTTALALIGVYQTREYAAFGASSDDPVSERFLDQLRPVTSAALRSIFAADAAGVGEQALTVHEAVAAFVAAQRAKWNGSPYSAPLAGSAGGDGDWAKESLAFGFHVENTYWGVYRVWSRPWLVTK